MDHETENIIAEIEEILKRLTYDQLCLILTFALQML